MKTKTGALLLSLFGLLTPLTQAWGATITFYDSEASWTAAVSSHSTEAFDDATLNPEISVTTDDGEVANGRWEDRLTPGFRGDTTTFEFSPSILAFGGSWDLSPAGAGRGIAVTVGYAAGGSELLSEEISDDSTGEFWGFVSDMPVASVLLTTGTQRGVAETFHLDDMVYSPVPIPPAALLLGSGLFGLFAATRRSPGKC